MLLGIGACCWVAWNFLSIVTAGLAWGAEGLAWPSVFVTEMMMKKLQVGPMTLWTDLHVGVLLVFGALVYGLRWFFWKHWLWSGPTALAWLLIPVLAVVQYVPYFRMSTNPVLVQGGPHEALLLLLHDSTSDDSIYIAGMCYVFLQSHWNWGDHGAESWQFTSVTLLRQVLEDVAQSAWMTLVVGRAPSVFEHGPFEQWANVLVIGITCVVVFWSPTLGATSNSLLGALCVFVKWVQVFDLVLPAVVLTAGLVCLNDRDTHPIRKIKRRARFFTPWTFTGGLLAVCWQRCREFTQFTQLADISCPPQDHAVWSLQKILQFGEFCFVCSKFIVHFVGFGKFLRAWLWEHSSVTVGPRGLRVNARFAQAHLSAKRERLSRADFRKLAGTEEGPTRLERWTNGRLAVLAACAVWTFVYGLLLVLALFDIDGVQMWRFMLGYQCPVDPVPPPEPETIVEQGFAAASAAASGASALAGAVIKLFGFW